MSGISPLETLFDVADGRDLPLPPVLADLYGALRFPVPSGRPRIVANFVSTLDGVVELGDPASAGGKAISGANSHDRMVMGLLRAAADVVIVGAGTYRASSGHRWTAARAYPPLADAYARFRRALGKAETPLTAVVTAQGGIDLTGSGDPTAPLLVVTTDLGASILRDQAASAAIRIANGGAGPLTARCIIDLVLHVQPSNLILLEGGPHLMGEFVAQRCLDELFLTVAPQIAGRNASAERPGLVAGKLFAPDDPRWSTLSSVRRAGDHLFLRYAFSAAVGRLAPC